MLLVDISSLSLNNSVTTDEVLSSSYMIQESQQTESVLFFVDKNKDTSSDYLLKSIEEKNIKIYYSEDSLYQYLDALQDKDSLEIITQDYLALSRLSRKDVGVWDISTMKRYTKDSLSENLLGFPNESLGLFVLLNGDPYHKIAGVDKIASGFAAEISKAHGNVKSLLTSTDIDSRIKPHLGNIKQLAVDLKDQLKLKYLHLSPTFEQLNVLSKDVLTLNLDNIKNDIEDSSYVVIEKISDLISSAEHLKDYKDIIVHLDGDDVLIKPNADSPCFIFKSSSTISLEKIFNGLKDIFESFDIKKTTYDAKRLHRKLIESEIKSNGINFDVMLANYILDNRNKEQSIETIMSDVFFENITYPFDDQGKALKVEHILRLKDKLSDTLDKESLRHLTAIEMPHAKVLANMEHKGIYVNATKLGMISDYIAGKVKSLTDSLATYSEGKCNVNSPDEVVDLIFNKLNLSKGKIKKSSSEATLEKIKLINPHPVIDTILSLRSLTKLDSSYASKLPKMINPKTNNIHCTYNQAKTLTGRLSSKDPCLQNIPAKTMLGKKIKQAFESIEGRKIIAADYSQIELKILAHLSQEPTLINAFKQGLDIHKSTAAVVFDKDVSEISGEERKYAKAINFGLIYGMTEYGLSAKLKCTPEVAKGFINKYFESLPKVKEFILKTQEFAKQNGYVKTITGRRIYINGINGKGSIEHALRAASNAPMQGSASDVIKIAMNNLHYELINNDLDASLRLQIHDEVVIETCESVAEKVAKLTKKTMENAVNLLVDMDVEVEIGLNWEQAHSIDEPDPEPVGHQP
jgi:DNA polymerase-1